MNRGALRCVARRRPAPVPTSPSDPAEGPPARGPGWHDALIAFKRCLLAGALARAGGNRTRAARSLGLQRTYLLRLLRTIGVSGGR